jgi:heat shock protein HslJ
MTVRWPFVVALVALFLATAVGLTASAASPSPGLSLGSGRQALAEPPVAGEVQLAFEGIHWRLTHVGADSKPVPPSVVSWVSLVAGHLEGWDGCGPLRGAYGRVGQAIRVRPSDGAGGECDRAHTRIAGELRSGLVRASSASLLPGEDDDPALVLRDAAGQDLLRFVPDDVASLTDETWQLTAWTADGQARPAATDLAAVLTFGSDARKVFAGSRRDVGTLVGSSGCNGIVGTYERQGSLLGVDGLRTTDAPCSAVLASQEAAMVDVLSSDGLVLELPPDRLILTDTRTGDRLELVTATPLEGSTWLLAGIPRLPSGRGTVTMRLEGGVVAGEGPCGPYEGAYETDGRVIRLSGLRGPGEECPDLPRQRRLLLALERAVIVDRDQPQLRLLDAFGRLVARFRHPPGP